MAPQFINEGPCYRAISWVGRTAQNERLRLRGLIKNRVSIRERPILVEYRERVGDWEGDLVEGKKGTGFAATHVDRSSRFLIARKIENKQSSSFNEATINAFKAVCSSKIHTLTLDNGKEFSAFEMLENAVGFKVYFADPYCSWQRGTNENINGLLRRFLPKGTDFFTLTNGQLQSLVDTINHRPRKALNYRTPFEVFNG